jgi:hypothetical protein
MLERDVRYIRHNHTESASTMNERMDQNLKISDLHHGGGDDEQHEAEQEAPTRVVFLVKRLRSPAASSSTATTAEAKTYERHQECRDDRNDGNDNYQPVLLEDIIVLMLLHIRTQASSHIINDDVTCKREIEKFSYFSVNSIIFNKHDCVANTKGQFQMF